MKHQALSCPSTEVLNIRLKYLATICNGQDYKDVVDDDGEYPVMGSGGPFARATDYLYDKASVLLGRKGTIDNPLYVDYPFWTVDTMFYTRVKSIVSAKYLYYLAKTIPFDYYKYGSAIPSMTQRDLGNICFPVPRDEDVKNKIVDYLDSRTATIDRVLSEKKTLIELLKEKKTMDANEELRTQARNNSQEHFRFPFNDAFMDVVIGRMAQNQQFCERVLDDVKFGDTVRDLLVGVVYNRLRQSSDGRI